MFHRCKNKEDAQTLFRKLAKYLHPDTGGDHECFIILGEAYEIIISYFESGTSQDPKEKEFKGNPSKYHKTHSKVKNDEADKLAIFSEIFRYADNHKRFNKSYVESIHDYLLEKGFVTSYQYNSLVKIYYSFRMDEESKE